MINYVDEKYILKNQNAVVVLDLGYNALYALNAIKQELKDETIIYLNDLNKETYDVVREDEIFDLNAVLENIKELIARAIKYNPKLIIVANDSIIEYGKDLLDAINVEKVYITDVIIEEINKNYEYKNMAFFASQGIIEANLYQHNFHYTRLYNLNADNITDALKNFKMKTSDSFNQVKNALLPLYKKDVDVIIPTYSNILLFSTEILEYVKDQNKDVVILNIDELLAKSARNSLGNSTKASKKKKNTLFIVKNREELNKNKKELKQALSSQKKTYEKVLKVDYKIIYE